MILFELKCDKDHHFEGWFRDGKGYDAQTKAGKLVCPVCGSRRIEKAMMAPRIGKGARKADAKPEAATVPVAPASVPAVLPPEMKAVQLLRELRKQVEANCDYVGPQFAEEARKIHYGETEARGIYGETTAEEAEALDEEGIEFARVPWVPRQDS
ncbi:MAG TPA: DUF1178 family protein [Hypericibacter adhaerens]|jgi:hypothetical protein|uniref:DUF1178 domain-containing protein n=1 Tax=Hypericibacter adhaerens TaxID=2602016 RepID=A0A5J6N2V8_9PROT|nr:DUF1178 family protein [Hypericibacter adhaerens]QEX24292.1 hypothetical protein FRZ61_42330 [Hypericibacter adhaerens]HWA43532.1 DUF1178 family protein [Hypericibacter adhaerens]